MQLGLASLRLRFMQDVQLSNTAQFWQQNNQNAKYNLKQTLEIGVFFPFVVASSADFKQKS